MAKETKKPDPKAKGKKEEAPAKAKGKTNNLPKKGPRDGEVGVAYLAEKMGIEPASVRIKLRNEGVETVGGVYSWPEAKADKIIERLTAKKDKKAA